MRQSALAASISRFEALAFLVGFLPGECLSPTLVSTATADYLLCGEAGVVLVRPRTG